MSLLVPGTRKGSKGEVYGDGAGARAREGAGVGKRVDACKGVREGEGAGTVAQEDAEEGAGAAV